MNVATRLKLEQMESDIKELKRLVITLSESVAYLQGEQVGRRLEQTAPRETGQRHVDDVVHVVPAALAGKTLTLPEKRKSV